MCRLTGQKLLVESPAIYASPDMQAYITQELNRPCKRWVVDVLNGSRVADAVRLRTGGFVLLPDRERVNRYTRAPPEQGAPAKPNDSSERVRAVSMSVEGSGPSTRRISLPSSWCGTRHR
jgi:hypothetical protein